MAKKYDIDIDSFIGDWNCNKRNVKRQLNDLGEKEITVRVNSLGGDVDTALDIAAQFEAHGNIVCDLYAFNASAATILTMGAKKVRMHENGMYLIHKAMVWVDEFGHMNEDDLDIIIEKLKNKQQDSAVVTLNIAKMYAKKSGKTIQEILNLMKQERWLDANAAKEWGFVDETFFGSIPAKKQPDMVEMLNIANLPIPENFSQEENESEPQGKSWTDLLNYLRNIFSNHKPENQMNKTMIQAALLLSILNVENLEATDGNVSLTSDQITEIENAISGKDAEIATLKNQLSQKETEIANLKTEIENKKNAPGDTTRDVNKDNDEIDNDDEYVFDNSAVEAAKALYDALP